MRIQKDVLDLVCQKLQMDSNKDLNQDQENKMDVDSDYNDKEENTEENEISKIYF